MKHVGLARSATPATQNDITACFETCNEERFCSFPHRQRDGTKEASESRRDMLEHQNEHFRARLPYISHFAASKRLETRHLGASIHFKTSFSCETSSNSQTSPKSTFSYGFSYGPTSKSMFRARLPSIFSTCHKVPRLPRNLHVVATSCSTDT